MVKWLQVNDLSPTMVGNAWNGIPCGGGGVLSKQPGHDDIPKIWTPQRCMTPTAMIFIAFLKDKSYNSLFSYWCLAGNEGMIHWLTINNHPIPPFPSIPYQAPVSIEGFHPSHGESSSPWLLTYKIRCVDTSHIFPCHKFTYFIYIYKERIYNYIAN